ncbi:MAG: cation:proton antiporter regulatory subunit [Desulfobacterales bacterium]
MKVKTSDLPGIGKSYAIETAEGSRIVIVIHHKGHREIFYFQDPDQDEPDISLTLNDEEARQISTILLGVDYQPVAEDRIELLLKSVRIDWFKVEPGSFVAEKTILQAQIRSHTGTTIIAIQRGDKMIGSPDIHEKILPGDTLMCIGNREQTQKLESLCQTQ